jgi:hypothetical protein
MAITDAQKNKINKMNRAAQDALLGTAIQDLQNAITVLTGISAGELGYIDGITAGIATASKAVVLDTNGQFTFTPARGSVDYAYGVKFSPTDTFFTGGAAKKSYLVYIGSDRPVGSAATGDSNDALLRMSGNNYAANDTNFIFRGINISMNNRSGGTIGRIDNNLGVQGKSGGTVGTLLGLMVTSENYGIVSDLFGGIDVLLKNEAAVATTEFGIRIRNENNSIAGTVDAAILITDTGANTGWTSIIKQSGDLANVFNFAAANSAVVVAAGSGLTHDPNAATSDAYMVVTINTTRYASPLYEI